MSIAAWVLFGVLTGFVFNLLDRQSVGRRLVYPALGTAGAVLGALSYHVIGDVGSAFNARSLVVAVMSAVGVLIVYRWTQRGEPAL